MPGVQTLKDIRTIFDCTHSFQIMYHYDNDVGDKTTGIFIIQTITLYDTYKKVTCRDSYSNSRLYMKLYSFYSSDDIKRKVFLLIICVIQPVEVLIDKVGVNILYT